MSNKTSKIHNVYDVRLIFRLSKHSYNVISSYCVNNNMSVSDFLRKLIDNFVINYEKGLKL